MLIGLLKRLTTLCRCGTKAELSESFLGNAVESRNYLGWNPRGSQCAVPESALCPLRMFFFCSRSLSRMPLSSPIVHLPNNNALETMTFNDKSGHIGTPRTPGLFFFPRRTWGCRVPGGCAYPRGISFFAASIVSWPWSHSGGTFHRFC